MNYQTQNSKRHKDPFSVLPLPKSFYHPSPTKDVNEKEAIKSPQRRSDPTTLWGREKGFLKEGQTFRTSALPDIRTLRDLQDKQSGLLKETDIISSSHLNESWPESEIPSSVSTSGNTSALTLAYEDSKVASSNNGDVVRNLDRLNYQPNFQGGADVNLNDTSAAGESVLQRYIERFRKSVPKSREERLKEKEDKPQFWWLHSSPGSRSEPIETGQGESGNQLNDIVKETFSESQVKKQLTKEALLALDEETFQLQSKADRLLSKSELSLASSPIVSTDGLGSSASVSSLSVMEDKNLYRPAVAKGQEFSYRQEPKPFARREGKTKLEHVASNSPSDDILARWRLRHRMDEATTTQSLGHFKKCPSVKPSQSSGINTQLEEFRKKILYQKALVTHEDICYERQRMAMMMDDIQQDGGVLNKEVSHASVQPLQLMKDTVLERMQKITGSKNITNVSLTEEAILNLRQEKTLPASSLATNINHNFSINNANFSNAGLLRKSNKSATIPALDKNNTASSGYHIPHNTSLNNDRNPEFFVDNFESQVVCDPKKERYFLGSSTTKSFGGDPDNLGSCRVKEFITGMEKARAEESVQDGTSAGHVFEAPPVTQTQNGNAKYIENEVSIESNQRETFKESQRNVQSGIDSGNNQSASSEGENNVGFVQRGNESFYQFLEAEKPISESKGTAKKLERKKDKLIAKDCSSKSITSEEGGENARESTWSDSEGRVVEDTRRLVRKQENKKYRSKTQSVKGRDKENEDSARNEVLVDITNEGNNQSGKMALSHLHRNDQKTTHKNKDFNICSNKLHQQSVQHVIGQAVTEHLFDGSTLMSSVDSWTSMFPQSPELSHSQRGSTSTPMSSTPSQKGSILYDSATVVPSAQEQQADEDYESDGGEFCDDPLLQILRQQRDLYLQQLKDIEKKLQDMDT